MHGTTPNRQPTVTQRFTQALLQSASRRGLALPCALVAELQAGERVALAAQDRLWDVLCENSGDPLVGLELGLAIQVGHLDTAGMLLMSSNTVGDALAALLDYHPIVGEGGGFELQRGAVECVVVYRPYYATRRSERVEAVMGCLLNLARWTTGDAFRPAGVTFAHPPLAAPERYAERLGAAVRFGTQDNGLVFDASNLHLPLSQANPALCRHLHALADDELDGLASRSLSGRIRHVLNAHPGWGKERAAAQLNMSGRHLVRRLGEEGTSFKSLQDELRRRLAERALRENRRTCEIAERLGFADERAFAKAFKRWTAMTPAVFRESQPARSEFE